MPIQIINSGVKLTPEPNTISTVVARNETGVICRVSASLPTRRTRRFSHQGMVDGSDGGGGIDRQADGGDGGQTSAGQASSPYDMTSVFGLKVGHSSSLDYGVVGGGYSGVDCVLYVFSLAPVQTPSRLRCIC